MARPEDRQEAEELLSVYRRRLRIRDYQLAKLGDSADPSITLDRDELLLSIAALEPVVEVEPKKEAKGLVQRVLADDLTLLYVQGARANTRLVQVEVQQHEGQKWRLAVAADMQKLKDGFAEEKAARRRGQRLRIALEVAVIIVALLLHMNGWL